MVCGCFNGCLVLWCLIGWWLGGLWCGFCDKVVGGWVDAGLVLRRRPLSGGPMSLFPSHELGTGNGKPGRFPYYNI